MAEYRYGGNSPHYDFDRAEIDRLWRGYTMPFGRTEAYMFTYHIPGMLAEIDRLRAALAEAIAISQEADSE